MKMIPWLLPAKQQQRFLPTSPATPRRAGSLKGYYSQFNEDIKFFEWYKTAGLSVLYNYKLPKRGVFFAIYLGCWRFFLIFATY
jgi:hypothetical protein